MAGALRPQRPDRRSGPESDLIEAVKQRSADVANQYRNLLVQLYGEQKGRNIKYAEAFELNQYGGPATADQLKTMFPTFQ